MTLPRMTPSLVRIPPTAVAGLLVVTTANLGLAVPVIGADGGTASSQRLGRRGPQRRGAVPPRDLAALAARGLATAGVIADARSARWTAGAEATQEVESLQRGTSVVSARSSSSIQARSSSPWATSSGWWASLPMMTVQPASAAISQNGRHG